MTNRRQLLSVGAALTASFSLSKEAMAFAAKTSNPVAATQYGPVFGRRAGAINVFKGIPFARPPIGALRFRPPEPPYSWTRPRDAGAFGAAPIQTATMLMNLPGETSENCLTLNVWAPAARGPHPVLFELYGGGNILGSSSQPAYDGAAFAERGLVFVSANYRVGALGYLELGGVDPDYAGSGLNGLRDIVAALGWVRDNIAAFGGEPNRVSLMGQSAGAKNACALAAIPSARGLFHQIAIQSGGGDTVFNSPAEAAPVARAMLEAAKLGPRDMRGLLTLPANDLLKAQTKVIASFPRGFPFRPTVDGAFLPVAPIDAARSGVTADLEIVIGTARDEAALFIPPPLASRPFQPRQVANLAFEKMLTLEAAYAALLPDLSLAERHIRQLTAEEYWIPSVRFAEAHARAGGKAWMYRFDQPLPTGPFAGYAAHGSDGAFIFGRSASPAFPLAQDALPDVARVQAMWANWALSGDHRLEGAPDWPLYDPQNRSTLIIDREPHIENDPHRNERLLWNGLL